MQMYSKRMWATPAFLAGLFLLSSISLEAQDDVSTVPEANPARPTVSTPATLSPVGYLQFETGILHAVNSTEFSRRIAIEQVTKISIDSRIEFLAVFEPIANSAADVLPVNEPGDIAAGVQVVAIPGKGSRPTIAAQYLRRLYSGSATDLDLGSFVQSAAIFASGDPWGFHYDLNGLVMEQQDDVSKIRKPQFAQTLSISHPVGKVVVSGEMWHFAQPLTHSSAVGNLWCVSYELGRNLVLDAGFDKGLTSTSTDWEGIAGFTYLLPHRLWRKRNAIF